MTDEQAVLTERRGRVLTITLDGDDELRVGVLTGAGKGFCAGMDLKAFVSGESPHVDGRGFAGIAQRSADKPLIAAIEGFAVAGGLEIALSCDLIVAANAPLALAASKRIVAEAPGVGPERGLGQAGRDRRAGVRLRGRPRGRDGVRGEARARLEGPLGTSI